MPQDNQITAKGEVRYTQQQQLVPQATPMSAVRNRFKTISGVPTHTPPDTLEDQILYDEATNTLYFYINGQWRTVGGSSSNLADDNCFIGMTSDQTLPDTTTTKIDFDNDSGSFINGNNNFDTSNNTYTAPAAGIYNIALYLEVDGRDIDYKPFVYLNGSQKFSATFYCSTPSRNQFESRMFNYMISLAAGDEIDIRCYPQKLGSTDPKIQDSSTLSITRLS